MQRRDLIKAGVADADVTGISTGRAAPEEAAAQADTPVGRAGDSGKPAGPLVSLYDFEAAAKRRLSIRGVGIP